MAAVQTKEIEKYLKNLAETIVPSDEFLTYGTGVVQKVFEVLEQNSDSEYRVDRKYIVGSSGKHTSIAISTDFDVVLFINKQEPPFKEALDDFEKILKKEKKDKNGKEIKLTFEVNNIERGQSKYNVPILQFQAGDPGKQKIAIDLVPASNLLEPRTDGTGHDKSHQVANVFQKITKDYGKKGYEYSSSLAEAGLEFLRLQSSFVHDLIRLAKFWNKTLHLNKYISGRSALIELVAIAAAQEEEKFCKEAGETRSLLRGFQQRFLKRMAEFQKLKIEFEDFNPLKELNDGGGSIDTNAWGRAVALARKNRSTPYIVDPINPFNNFAKGKGMDEGIMKKFETFALKTSDRITSCKNLAEVHLIFLPQPEPREMLGVELAKKFVNTAVVDTKQGGKELHSQMIMRNKKDWEGKVKAEDLKILQTCFSTNIHAFLNSGTGTKTPDQIKQMLNTFFYKNILGMAAVGNVRPVGNHEQYDVTFIIPYCQNNQKYTAMVSGNLPRGG